MADTETRERITVESKRERVASTPARVEAEPLVVERESALVHKNAVEVRTVEMRKAGLFGMLGEVPVSEDADGVVALALAGVTTFAILAYYTVFLGAKALGFAIVGPFVAAYAAIGLVAFALSVAALAAYRRKR